MAVKRPKLGIVRRACTCGWETPKNIRLDVSAVSTVFEVSFCPQCGATHYPVGMKREDGKS